MLTGEEEQLVETAAARSAFAESAETALSATAPRPAVAQISSVRPRTSGYPTSSAARPANTSTYVSTATSSCVTDSVHSSSRPGVMKMPLFIE